MLFTYNITTLSLVDLKICIKLCNDFDFLHVAYAYSENIRNTRPASKNYKFSNKKSYLRLCKVIAYLKTVLATMKPKKKKKRLIPE